MKIFKTTLGVIGLLLATVTQSFAQDGTGTIQATADVAASATVTGTDLNFGTGLAQGTPVTIDPVNDAGAGHFTVTGTTGAEVNAVLTLPTNLTHDIDGATTLPVSFSATSASWALAGTDQATSTVYDPSTTLTQSLDAASGELHIWLGGTASPGASQKGGAYSGTVQLDITYTGN